MRDAIAVLPSSWRAQCSEADTARGSGSAPPRTTPRTENAMTAKLKSKLLAAALSVAPIPALAADASELVVSSAAGAAVYPVYVVKEAPPLEEKDAPKPEQPPQQEQGRDGKCPCHT
jgi:hypothetical protein